MIIFELGNSESRQADFEVLSVTDTQRIFFQIYWACKPSNACFSLVENFYGRRISIFEFEIFILARLMHIFVEIMTHLEKG